MYTPKTPASQPTVAVEEPSIPGQVATPAPTPIAQTASNDSRIVVIVNGQTVVMTGKPNYIFVDVFEFYPFDLSKVQGTELVITLNGVKAEFVAPLLDGSIIEVYWK